jgi:hypothetical protein
MEYEMIGFIDIKHSRRENEKILDLQFPTVDPESMFNEKDKPLRYHTEHFYSKHPLAVKLESTACGPTGEFTDRGHVLST